MGLFCHLQQNGNVFWQAIVLHWHSATTHFGDRSLMCDYSEHCVPAGTFRGQEEFEIH